LSILFRKNEWLTLAQLARAWATELAGAERNPIHQQDLRCSRRWHHTTPNQSQRYCIEPACSRPDVGVIEYAMWIDRRQSVYQSAPSILAGTTFASDSCRLSHQAVHANAVGGDRNIAFV
jgi:hypothetical protein